MAAPDAAPPSDVEIERAVAAFNADFKTFLTEAAKTPGESIETIYARHLAPLSIEFMSSEQIAALPLTFFQFGDGMQRGLATLESAVAADPHDLYALIRLVDLLAWTDRLGYTGEADDDPARLCALMQRIVDHPDLDDAVRSSAATIVLHRLPLLGADEYGSAEQRAAIQRLAALCDDGHADPSFVVGMAGRWDDIRRLGFGLDQLESVRTMLERALQGALAQLDSSGDPNGGEDSVMADGRAALSVLQSPNALRELVGSEAPDLEFVWSTAPGLTSLRDLRGGVVLIEFWVTGCGHCLASIPRLQELATRYEDYGVTILGVTSVQGSHYDPATKSIIDTAGDPEREFALMREFIRQTGVQWPIVFSTASAWNPAYGVRGTPHLTLIAPDGEVVANDMHPYDGLASNAKRIDALLKKCGMATPPRLEAPD